MVDLISTDSVLGTGTNRMTPELERAVKRYRQWFGSYKKSGELIKVQVWLTVNSGCIEFLTLDDLYKVKRIWKNPRVICYIGDKEGPHSWYY